MTMKDIRPAKDVPVFRQYVARAPDLPPRVWCHRKKDGTLIFVEVTMQPVALRGSTALLALANDVTARVRAEKTRSRAETTLLIAQRIARLGNWYWNIETGELDWSTEIYRLFGVPETPAGVTYETFLAAVHPDDRERVERAIRDAVDRHAVYDLDHRVLRPDGTVLIVHEQGEVTRGNSGKALRMIGTVQDVTARRRAEAELRESEERYRILFEANPMPMWVSDPETLSYLDVNKAAIEHYGFSREEFLAMTLERICPPEENPDLPEYLASQKDGPLPVRVWRHRKKDGTAIEVEVTNHPVVYNGPGSGLARKRRYGATQGGTSSSPDPALAR